MKITANRLWQLVRTISVIGVMSGIALTAGVANHAAADSITITLGQVKNAAYTSECIHVPGSSKSSGTFLDFISCGNTTTYAKWYSYSVGGGYYSLNPANNTGLCMDVPGSHLHTVGERIEQWTCNGGYNQAWLFTHYPGNASGQYQIMNRGSSMCLDVDPTNALYPVQNPCDIRTNINGQLYSVGNQSWYI